MKNKQRENTVADQIGSYSRNELLPWTFILKPSVRVETNTSGSVVADLHQLLRLFITDHEFTYIST